MTTVLATTPPQTGLDDERAKRVLERVQLMLGVAAAIEATASEIGHLTVRLESGWGDPVEQNVKLAGLKIEMHNLLTWQERNAAK